MAALECFTASEKLTLAQKAEIAKLVVSQKNKGRRFLPIPVVGQAN
jgi:hypothetical protein